MQNESIAGLGNPQGPIHVYIQHRPSFLLPGGEGEVVGINGDIIQQINAACGNGWRKVFNVYAKWVFQLDQQLSDQQITVSSHSTLSWQQYRDSNLLTHTGVTALLFTPPASRAAINIVMGKTYAKSMGLTDKAQWIRRDFGIIDYQQMIITPYFDYRQLTNDNITFLTNLVSTRWDKWNNLYK